MYYVQSRAGPGVLLSQSACYSFLQTVLEAEAVLQKPIFPKKATTTGCIVFRLYPYSMPYTDHT